MAVQNFIDISFPSNISRGAVGGPQFYTDISTTFSGHEYRNINWQDARALYDVSHGVKTPTQMEQLWAFFRIVRGKGYGFRFKDWADYTVTTTTGIIGLPKSPFDSDATITGSEGNNSSTLQLYKRYQFDSYNPRTDVTTPYYYDRIINKLVDNNTFKFYKDDVLLTSGVDYLIDYDAGVVELTTTDVTLLGALSSSDPVTLSGDTFITRVSSNLSVTATNTYAAGDVIYYRIQGTYNGSYNITTVEGYTTITSATGSGFVIPDVDSQIYTFTSGYFYNPPLTGEVTARLILPSHGLTAGEILCLSDLSNYSSTLDGGVFIVTVSSVATTDVVILDLNLANTNDIISVKVTKAPGDSVSYSWSGEFDVPVRFDTDLMQVSMEAPISMSWENINLIEVRL